MRYRLLTRFVPLVMLTVFLVQLTLVEFGNLDRWKGMGMGMFSAIRERGIERLEIRENGQWRDARVEAIELAPGALVEFSQFPNQWTEARLLQRLSAEVESTPTAIRSRVSGVAHFAPRTGLVTEKLVYDSTGE